LANIPAEKGMLERKFARSLTVVGVDEVGRGCLAGPVYAAAASLCYASLDRLDPASRALIRDSKTLSRSQREKILSVLAEIAVSYAIGVGTVSEIESLGIVGATFLAMRRAISSLSVTPGIVLVDGNRPISDYSGQQKAIVKGDSLCYSIAAASIFAKEARDLYMTEQSAIYPDYGFENHVGYGTKAHMTNIDLFGICPLHRRNFAPISARS
jgi:ribonuclease HII